MKGSELNRLNRMTLLHAISDEGWNSIQDREMLLIARRQSIELVVVRKSCRIGTDLA